MLDQPYIHKIHKRTDQKDQTSAETESPRLANHDPVGFLSSTHQKNGAEEVVGYVHTPAVAIAEKGKAPVVD